MIYFIYSVRKHLAGASSLHCLQSLELTSHPGFGEPTHHNLRATQRVLWVSKDRFSEELVQEQTAFNLEFEHACMPSKLSPEITWSVSTVVPLTIPPTRGQSCWIIRSARRTESRLVTSLDMVRLFIWDLAVITCIGVSLHITSNNEMEVTGAWDPQGL